MILAIPLLIFVLVVISLYANKETKHCRWRAVRQGNVGARHLYRCAACGAQDFTNTGKEPQYCKAKSAGKSQ